MHASNDTKVIRMLRNRRKKVADFQSTGPPLFEWLDGAKERVFRNGATSQITRLHLGECPGAWTSAPDDVFAAREVRAAVIRPAP